MNSQLEKIQIIKKARLLQNLQSDLENCLMQYLYSTNSTNIMNNIRQSMSEIIREKTNDEQPIVDISYNNSSYYISFKLKTDNFCVKISNI